MLELRPGMAGEVGVRHSAGQGRGGRGGRAHAGVEDGLRTCGQTAKDEGEKTGLTIKHLFCQLRNIQSLTGSHSRLLSEEQKTSNLYLVPTHYQELF